MAETQSTFEVYWEFLGRTSTRVESYSIDSGFLTSTDAFEFTLYSDDRSEVRDVDMQPVTLKIDGKPQLFGRVERTTRGNNGTAVLCEGRDFIGELVECNVLPKSVKVTDGTTLKQFILDVAGVVGVLNVEGDGAARSIKTGIRNSSTGTKFEAIKLNEVKEEPETGIFDFINKVLARHGLTLQPGKDRFTVEVSEPNYLQAPSGEIRRLLRNDSNNVLQAVSTRDYSSAPTTCLFTGKQGRSSESRSPMRNELFLTEQIRGYLKQPNLTLPYRLLYLRDEKAKNLDQLLAAQYRAIAERMKDTLSYRVTLRGHRDPSTGNLWGVDTILNVRDEPCDIDEPLWVAKRRFTNRPGEGERTELEMWRPGAFVIGTA